VVEKELTSRDLMAMLRSEFGVRGAARILVSIRRRMKKLPKKQPMTQEQFMIIVDEEAQEFARGLK